MLRYPAKRYVHYLFSRRVLKVDKIIEHLDDLEFPLPQDTKSMSRLMKNMMSDRQRMRFPSGFDPSKLPFNPSTSAFLMDWEISDIWAGDEFMRVATDILHEPQIRRTLETFLLSPLNPQAIARRLQQRFMLPERVMNPKVVKLYSHYYWDYSAMNNAEWKEVFQKWMSQATDDYQTALSAPRSAAGAALSLAVADRSLDSLNPVVHYSTMRDTGFRMFLEAAILQRPGLARAQSAFLAFQMVKGADEELVKHRGSSAELLEELRRIDTTYDTSKVIGVQDLPSLRRPDVKALPAIVDTHGETVEEHTDDKPDE